MVYKYLFYRITLEAPAILPSIVGDPHSANSLPYIPGSAVRGVFARIIGDNNRGEFNKYINSDLVRWLNAYPEFKGVRTLPMPLTIRREKGVQKEEEGKVYDISVNWPDKQLVSVGVPFAHFGAELVPVSPRMGTRFHHQRDRVKGRPWKKVGRDKKEEAFGAIFYSEYLEKGQSFIGIVLLACENKNEFKELEEEIKDKLKGEILIGRSKRAGYGGLGNLEWLQMGDTEITDGMEQIAGPEFFKNNQNIDELRLLFTSDCIVRDSVTGQIDPAALEDELLKILDNKIFIEEKFLKYGKVGAFNRKWRLEVPQAYTISAGSVVKIKLNDSNFTYKLQKLLHEGLGERRNEGFGRIALLQTDKKINLKERDETSKYSEKVSSKQENNSPPKLIRFIQKRILWKKIGEQLTEKAFAISKNTKKIPTNNLLSRLKTPLRQNSDRVLGHLKIWITEGSNSGLKEEAMEKLKNCKINGEGSLRDYLEKIIREKVSDLISIDEIEKYSLTNRDIVENFVIENEEKIKIKFLDIFLSALILKNKQLESGDR